MTNRTSIRDQLAARRAAAVPLRGGPAGSTFSPASRAALAGTDALPERTVTAQVAKAARTGKLDVSQLDLDRVPVEVYTTLLGIPADQLSRPPAPERKEESDVVRGMTSSLSTQLTLEGGGSRERAFGQAHGQAAKQEWSEPEELTSLRAEGNRIREIELEIGGFGGLKAVDLSSNQLESLPDAFADLLRLASLNLSHNAFTAIPPAVLLLPKLEVLDLSHNSIKSVSTLGGVEPSDDGVVYGAGFLSTSFSRAKAARPVLPVIRHLNLGHNAITRDVLELGALKVRVLNLESNALEGTLDVSKLTGLASLVLTGNAYLGGVQGEPEGCKVELSGTGTGTGISTSGAMAASVEGATDGKAGAAGQAAPRPIKPTCTVIYKTCPAATFDSLPLQIDMDVYLPPGPGTFPVVIWFHGGGLLQGNKENLPPHFRRLPTHSFDGQHCIVISPNYRLAPQAPIIDILGDMRECIAYVRDKLEARLNKEPAHAGYKVDAGRICLSGGSAGGYLALMGAIDVPRGVSDEDAGGYRGEKGIKCCAPFYPITDLTHPFWATETNPVPWAAKTIPHDAAKPHLNARDPPICTAVSGGPRSILYPYMLQHALFPSLLFQSQKSVGHGLDAFRPTPEALSITTRLRRCAAALRQRGEEAWRLPPTYLIYGDRDDKVNPLEPTVEVLREVGAKGEGAEARVVVEVREGMDHGFDEDEGEECEGFNRWLGQTLF